MAKTKPSAELAVIEKPEVQELINKSGIELTKAEAHASAFQEKFKELADLSRPLADLNKESPSKEDAKIARETRLKLVKVRTGSAEIKDDRKKILLVESNLIQGIFNVLSASCELTESQYLEIEKHEEKLKKERELQLSLTRKIALDPFETDVEFLPLGTMTDEQFDKLLAKEKESFEAVKAKREQDEINRLAEEKRLNDERIEAEKKAEQDRLEDARIEAERVEALRIENERLKKEQEERQKAEKNRIAKETANAEKLVSLLLENGYEWTNQDSYIEKEYRHYCKGDTMVTYHELFLMKEPDLIASIKQTDERIKLEAEKQAELEKSKAEAARLRKEAEEKQAGIDLQKEQEKQQLIAEQKEREAREKAARNAPDVDKLRALYKRIESFEFPEMATEDGKKIVDDLKDSFFFLNEKLAGYAKEMK